jgi:hypothetical protein
MIDGIEPINEDICLVFGRPMICKPCALQYVAA